MSDLREIANELGVTNIVSVANNIIELFQNREYEKHVLAIMNKSKIVFPGHYSSVEIQSHGESDYYDEVTSEKFDAKLPFDKTQVKLLTNGKTHAPCIKEWIEELYREIYSPIIIPNISGAFDIKKTKVYINMSRQVSKGKLNENIIFFIPFPVVEADTNGIFSQFAADYQDIVFDKLKKEYNFNNRTVYTIYPSGKINVFVARDLKSNTKERIEYCRLERYFYYIVTK